MKSYIYIDDRKGKIKIFLDELELKITNRFTVPNKNKKKELQLYSQETFKQKVEFKGLVNRVEIITKKWWEFWK